MELNELRIGNLIMFIDVNFIAVSHSTFMKIKRHPYWYEPILINEEWLIKFGFDIYHQFRDDHFRFEHKRYAISGFFYKNKGLKLSKSGMFYSIKYVHQLQNIVFCLRHKELELKD